MKIWKLGALALASLLTVAGTSASATTIGKVQRYGRVYARNVCGDVQVRGVARCFAKVVTDARGTIIEGKSNVTRNATPSGFGALDLRSAYKITTTGSPTYTIAIVDAFGYNNAENDLNVYRAQYGLPACTTANGCFKKVGQNGGAPPTRNDTGWGQEQAIDLQMASAM